MGRYPQRRRGMKLQVQKTHNLPPLEAPRKVFDSHSDTSKQRLTRRGHIGETPHLAAGNVLKAVENNNHAEGKYGTKSKGSKESGRRRGDDKERRKAEKAEQKAALGERAQNEKNHPEGYNKLNLERRVDAVDTSQLPEEPKSSRREKKDKEANREGEKHTSKRRQHMGGGKRNKKSNAPQIDKSEMEAPIVALNKASEEAPVPVMPDMDAIAAMRAQFQRPDGALDTKPPAFGEL